MMDMTRIAVEATRRSIKEAVKRTSIGAAGITVVMEGTKSIINGDDAGKCANNMISKGVESAISGAVSGAGGEIGFIIGAAINPVLAVPGAIVGGVVSGCAIGTVVDGAFSNLGNAAEKVVNKISEGVSDIAIDTECFFASLFA